MTNPDDRNGAFDRLLKSAQPDRSAGPAGACLDADTVAAWAENSLTSAERAAAEHHAADCARCQALLAAMARTGPVESPQRSRWVPALVRWGLPLTAAAAVALWVAVDRGIVEPGSSERAQEPSATAALPPASPRVQAPQAETRGTTEPRAAESSREREAGTARNAQVGAPDLMARKEVPTPAREPLDDRRAPAPPTAGAPLRDAAAESASPVAAPAAAPVDAQLPSVPPLPPERPQEVAKQLPPSSQSPAQEIPRGALAETVTTTTAERASAGARGIVARRQAPVAWIDVTSPDPLIRWRFSPQGQVERSIDGGVTWTRESFGRAPALSTGVAPSPSVCWLAGRDGVVLRFTSATGWQRVPLPVPADIVTIEATDAMHATVTFPGGRATTDNGGKTWY